MQWHNVQNITFFFFPYSISGISSLMLLSRTGMSLWKYEYLSLRCRSQLPTTAVTAFLTCHRSGKVRERVLTLQSFRKHVSKGENKPEVSRQTASGPGERARRPRSSHCRAGWRHLWPRWQTLAPGSAGEWWSALEVWPDCRPACGSALDKKWKKVRGTFMMDNT